MSKRNRGNPAERRALDAYVKLRRAVNSLTAGEAELHREGGLTESQFGVLEALVHLGPMCQKELAGKILKSAGNLTTVVGNLERRGLVSRKRSPEDRRMLTVHLTAAGDRLIRDLFPRHAARLTEAFAVLTPSEQEQLAALCRRLGRGPGPSAGGDP
jgi:MarR family 2-MHQ and catechol resistance regulon transcriptional repressor